jgi:hypothetical protein
MCTGLKPATGKDVSRRLNRVRKLGLRHMKTHRKTKTGTIKTCVFFLKVAAKRPDLRRALEPHERRCFYRFSCLFPVGYPLPPVARA